MTGSLVQSIDYVALAPVLALASTAGLVLVLDVLLPAARGRAGRAARQGTIRPAGGRRRLLHLVALSGVIVALVLVVAEAVWGRERGTFCVPAALSTPSASGGSPRQPATTPGAACSFVADDFSLIFAGVVLAAGIVVVLLSMAEPVGHRIPTGEWHLLLLSMLTGAVLLPASRDLIMLVVSLELVSLPVFALTALRRYDGRGAEAAVKLFLVSVVSTAVMLFGVSLLYGVTGSVFLTRIAGAAHPAGTESVFAAAVVLVLAGFAFKIAAVPFHFWAADVYQGAPVPVAALLSVISKAAGFAGLILVLTRALAAQSYLWAPIIAVLAALTMTAGNLLALRQRHAVRLLAWSSVAQSGYILTPLGVGAADEATSASIAYLVFYAAMNMGAFSVVMLVSRQDGDGGIDAYRGLAFRRPAAALSLAFFLICLAGLPPGLSGLFAKIVVFREVVSGGLGWLALVMAVNTVIGLCYYIAWAARLFTPATGPATAPGAPAAADPRAGLGDRTAPGRSARPVPAGVAVALAAAVSVVFSVIPQSVLSFLPSALG